MNRSVAPMEKWLQGLVTLTLIIYLLILVSSTLRATQRYDKPPDFPVDDDVGERFQVLVSNLDGSVTAIDGKNGDVLWSLQVGTKSLLSSSISNIQMINNGSPSRLIPSLDGGLYRMDGEGVEPIPLAADVLLTSTYKLTDDSSIVGGKEITTYGIDVDTGNLRYTCSSDRCEQVSDIGDGETYKSREVLVIKRTDRTIRLVDFIEGNEKWNFSVGEVDMSYHVKSDVFPTITGDSTPDAGSRQDSARETSNDFHPRFSLLDSNNIQVKVKMPTRTLWAGDRHTESQVYWKHQFESSIAGAWLLRGKELFPVNLFEEQRSEENGGQRTLGLMYIGVYNDMLYVQPSSLLEMHQVSDGDDDDDDDEDGIEDSGGYHGNGVTDTGVQVHMPRVKWKPYIATAPSRTRIISNQKAQNVGLKSDQVQQGSANPKDKSLALLSKNQYPFDGGYYLYLDYSPIEDYALCRNTTSYKRSKREEFIDALSRKWKELSLIFFIGMTSVFTFLRKKFHQFKRFSDQSSGYKSCSAQYDLQVPEVEIKRENSKEELEVSPQPFVSRYKSDFQQQQCLGRGGFGVVFKAYNKIDECSYAIKRISLKDSRAARERVMREVKALAKLDHPGIVRYYQSWLECPPIGWIEQNDDLSCRSTSAVDNETSDFTPTSSAGTHRRTGLSEADDFRVNMSPAGDDRVALTMEGSSVEIDFVASDDGLDDTERKSETVEFESDSALTEDSESYCVVGKYRQESLRRRCTTTSNSSVVFGENSTDGGGPRSSDYRDDEDRGDKVLKHRRDSRDKSHPAKVDKNSPRAGGEEKPRKLYLYIQMQLCRQESLKEWLTESPFDRDVTFDIFHQIVSAISYVHNQGLMHRDLKPSNIFFAMDGTIKIGDFGLVTDVESICCDDVGIPASGHSVKTAKRHTNQVGTQLYMSPELSSGGNYTHKVDIYALGVIFVEMFQRFSTHMERVRSLEQLRALRFPEHFVSEFREEYEFVRPLLSHHPNERPDASDLLKQTLLSNHEETSNLFRRLHRSRTLSLHSNSSSSGNSPPS